MTMASVSRVTLCWNCRTAVGTPIPESCPNCRKQLSQARNPIYGSPDYLWHQRSTALQDCDKDHPAAQVKVTDKTQIQFVEDQLISWARDCPAEDRLAAMHDAHLYLRHILHTDATIEEIRQLVSVGKAIGALAASIESYFRTGGVLHDGKVRQLPAFRDDVSGSDEATH